MRKELLVKSNIANVCYLLISIFVEIASDKQEDMGGIVRLGIDREVQVCNAVCLGIGREV